MTYQPIPQRTEGEQRRTLSSDERTRELLEEILIVLKKIEFHLYLSTDADLKDQDV